ncbi:hypothetical protein BDV3_004715 [Batrachochytrium dendrobatidis]
MSSQDPPLPGTPGGESGQLPDYLDASFDPNKTTIIQLVRILFKHNIELPASRQIKSYYVTMFNNHIAANRSALLKQRAKPTPKPSKKSIFYDASVTPSDKSLNGGLVAALMDSASNSTPVAEGKKRRRPVATNADTASTIDSTLQSLLSNVAATSSHVTVESMSNSATDDSIVLEKDNPFQTNASANTGIGAARAISKATPKKAAQSTPVGTPQKMDLEMDIFSDDNPFQSPSKPIAVISPNTKLIKNRQTAMKRQIPSGINSPLPFDPANIRFASPHESPIFNSTPSTNRSDSVESSPEKKSSRNGSRKSKKSSISPNLKHQIPVVPVHATASDVLNQPGGNLDGTPLRNRQSKSAKNLDKNKSTHQVNDFIDESLIKSHQKTSNTSTPLPSSRHRRQSRQSTFSTLPRIITGLVVMCAIGVFIMKSVDVLSHIQWIVPYCSSQSAPVFENISTSDASLEQKNSVCAPCPDNAICAPGEDIQCAPNFTLQVGTWSFVLGNQTKHALIVGRPRCVQDIKKLEQEARKQQRTTALVNILDDIVRTWIGKAECGQIKPSADIYWAWSATISKKQQRQVLGMPLSLARSNLRAVVPRSWTDATFDEYWQAVSSLISMPSPSGPLSTRLDDSTYQHRLIVSAHSPVITMTCQARRYIWGLVLAYSLHLTLVCGAVIASTLLYSIFQQYRQEQHVVAILVDDVLDMVHTESDNHHRDPIRYPAPGLSIVQLRDHLLLSQTRGKGQESFSSADGSLLKRKSITVPYMTYMDPLGRTIWAIPDATTRKRLWTLVTTEISKTSAIRKTTMEVKGQPQDLWMWVASPALSPRKPRSSGINEFIGTPISK